MFLQIDAIIHIESNTNIINMKANKAKLTCSLTGNTRQSSHKYIAKKAEQYGISSEVFQQYYTSKAAYLEFKQSLANEGVEATLTTHEVDEDTADKILRYNGKSQKTLADFTQTVNAVEQVETPADTPAEEEPELVGA